MEMLFLVLGAYVIGTAWSGARRPPVAPCALGVGLILVGLDLRAVALPVLIVALWLCWRDGTLARTYSCRALRSD